MPWVYIPTYNPYGSAAIIVVLSLHIGRSKSVCSRGWFRSTDLWVMGPARFLCATLLKESYKGVTEIQPESEALA